MRLTISCCVSVLLLVSGCIWVPNDTAMVADQHARVMDRLADHLNSGEVDFSKTRDVMQLIYIIENERRAANNLSDTLNKRSPTYPYPALFPDQLPWSPEDDLSGGEQ